MTSPDNYIRRTCCHNSILQVIRTSISPCQFLRPRTLIRVLLSCRNSATLLLLSCLLLFREPELLTWTFGKALNVKLLKSPLSRFIPRKTTLPSGCRLSRVNWGRLSLKTQAYTKRTLRMPASRLCFTNGTIKGRGTIQWPGESQLGEDEKLHRRDTGINSRGMSNYKFKLA